MKQKNGVHVTDVIERADVSSRISKVAPHPSCERHAAVTSRVAVTRLPKDLDVRLVGIVGDGGAV